MRNGMFHTLCFLTLMALLPGCSSTRYVDRHFTVPDHYEGFLVIRYDCPNGQPLRMVNRSLSVTFNLDGTFCTSDPFFATRGQVFVENESGQAIHMASAPRDERGYGYYDVGVRAIGGNTRRNPTDTDIVLSIAWVGDLEESPSVTGSTRYNLDAFLEERFGILNTH